MAGGVACSDCGWRGRAGRAAGAPQGPPRAGGAALVLCVLCYAGEWRINRWTYEVPAGTAQQASALNDALAELDGRVLFIPYGVRQRDSQLIETYVARDVYIVEYETLLQSGALADGVLDLTAEAVGPEYPGRAYTDLDAADWVLAADGVPVDTTTLEKADTACRRGMCCIGIWMHRGSGLRYRERAPGGYGIRPTKRRVPIQ